LQEISEKMNETKNVALVLSSGSSRGLAHIGAIEALEECGYHITSVAGCSMGAIVGGMYAAGKLSELKTWFAEMTRRKMLELTDFTIRKNYFVKGERIMEALGELIPDVQIEDLAMPLSLVATDMNSGKEVVFRSGALNKAIRSSFSIPVVLQPVRDGDMLLMDGGICNPLPLNRVARHKGDLLVSVNVSAPWVKEETVAGKESQEEKEQHDPSWLERLLEQRERLFGKSDEDEMGSLTILDKVSDVMIQQHGELMKQLCPPDINVDIATNQFGSFDYNHADEIIRFGHDKMVKAIKSYESELFRHGGVELPVQHRDRRQQRH